MILAMDFADLGTHGPKFTALPNDRWRRFVLALFELGHKNYTRAYMAAGFKSDNYEACQACSSRLAHDARIQEAILEEAQRRIKGLVPMAMKTVEELMENEATKDEVRAKLALDLMDRAGLSSVKEQKTTVEFIGADPQRIHRLKLIAEQTGVPFEKLVGERIAALAPPVDAEFTENRIKDEDTE